MDPASNRRAYERSGRRQEDKDFYRSRLWVALRNLVRSEEPLCRACKAEGRVSPTEQVDHVKPRKTHPELALDRDNLQGLCRECHNRKRATE